MPDLPHEPFALTVALLDRVSRRIRALSEDPAYVSRGWDLLFGRLRALPLLLEASGFLALRLDGHVITADWDSEAEVKIETNRRIIDLALLRGVRRYPDLGLEQFLPKKPESPTPCPHCAGTGVEPYAAKHRIPNVVCSCGGLGWIPGTWSESPP